MCILLQVYCDILLNFFKMPCVVSLSYNCCIKGSFPVQTTCGKVVGELQLTMSFKPINCDCESSAIEKPVVGSAKKICFR